MRGTQMFARFRTGVSVWKRAFPSVTRWEDFRMSRYVRGVISGGIATLVMTATMAAGQRVFRFGSQPPRLITRNVLGRLGLSPGDPATTEPVSWMTTHEMFGMTCGAGYILVRPLLPSSRYAAGLVFGGAVWAVSYLGYLPALGLYPAPDDDRRDRLTVMVVAHAVYGVVLAEVDDRLARRGGHG